MLFSIESKCQWRVLGLFFLILSSTVAHGDDLSQVSFNAFAQKEFTVPKEFDELTDGYRAKWQRLTGFELSGLHWNQFIVVFANQGKEIYRHNFNENLQLQQAFEDDEDYLPHYKRYPVGTVILKENFAIERGKPTTATHLTLMIKRQKGYSPKFGDWEFVESDLNGKILLKGRGESDQVAKRCGNCHLNMAERDFIFSTFFTEVIMPTQKSAAH